MIFFNFTKYKFKCFELSKERSLNVIEWASLFCDLYGKVSTSAFHASVSLFDAYNLSVIEWTKKLNLLLVLKSTAILKVCYR